MKSCDLITAGKTIFLTGLLLPWNLLLGQDGEHVIRARKTTTLPPVIDGVLDEPIWRDAPSVSGFVQFEPDKNQAASLKTVVRILYDEQAVYFGIICLDPEPEKVVLGTNRRDGLTQGTDSVTVSVDTFNDQRTAYYFRTNPAGVQHDGRISENGRVADTLWDGMWISAGAKIEEGWSAEIAIPLRALKYIPGPNKTWGLKMSRYIPRRFEKSFWSEPLTDTYRKVSTYGSLEGLDLEKTRRQAEFIPHIISRFQQGEGTDVEVGLDARYDMSRNISSHLTLNPDFATMEADQERVNLTRFELSLREKRNFFFGRQ